MTYPELFLSEFHSSDEVIIRTLEHRKDIDSPFCFFIGEIESERTRKGVKFKHNHSLSHATDKYQQFVGEKQLKNIKNPKNKKIKNYHPLSRRA